MIGEVNSHDHYYSSLCNGLSEDLNMGSGPPLWGIYLDLIFQFHFSFWKLGRKTQRNIHIQLLDDNRKFNEYSLLSEA